MTPLKRLFDLTLALVLSVLLMPAICLIALLILLIDGRPVFHRSQRMKTPLKSFTLWKFRSMAISDGPCRITSGHSKTRITQLGQFLRRSHLDEVPQLLNVLRGDMSLVGPRPPLPRYVMLFPEIYAKVLQNRPGITGLATVLFHHKEAELLSGCMTAAETDHVYITQCIPFKARLDMIWAANCGFRLDFMVLFATACHGFTRKPQRRLRQKIAQLDQPYTWESSKAAYSKRQYQPPKLRPKGASEPNFIPANDAQVTDATAKQINAV